MSMQVYSDAMWVVHMGGCFALAVAFMTWVGSMLEDSLLGDMMGPFAYIGCVLIAAALGMLTWTGACLLVWP